MKSAERKVYAPVPEVLAQVKERLDRGDRPDVITISGSGEPTLHREIGQVIAGIKGLSAVPVAVLTNGSLLFRPEVRAALRSADIVKPDLDAGSAELFERINRPHPDLNFTGIVEGLEAFADEFQGRLLLEVFLLGGLNDQEGAVNKIAALARRLKGARVQLNTVTRPAAEEFARRVPRERLLELARLFDPAAEVIADFKGESKTGAAGRASREEVLEMLARRPCTTQDIASGLGLNIVEAAKIVEELLAEWRIGRLVEGGQSYYHVR